MPVDSLIARLEGKVGPQTPMGDGVLQEYPRTGKTGELVVNQAVAKYYEAASRGKVFHACNQGAITFGTGLTATAVTFTLSNTLGSGVNLVVLHCGVTFITSTTAGSLVYAANVSPSAAAVVHGTPLTVYNAKLDGGPGLGLADAAATLPAAPVAVRTLASGFTTNANTSVHDYVDGAIIVAPGTALSIQGITIVGTGLIGMTWTEVPLQA